MEFYKKLKNKQQKLKKLYLIQTEKEVLTAPPGSGKTIIACSIIANRKLPTFILVHRAPIRDQWKKQITEFIKFDIKQIGIISGQKKHENGKVDIATMQTISKMKNDSDFLSHYGQIIIDECHHVPVFTVSYGV